jgi:hypothetical protein
VEALQGWERSVSELVDAFGRRKVLQPVVAEVEQSARANEGSRGGRHQHLPAMAAGSDARRPMHVDADVGVLSKSGSAGVDAHSHPDLTFGQSCLGICGCAQRALCCREGDEERVALRVHLDAAMGAKCRPEDAAMLRQRLGVTLRAELVQQPRRALDVRKEEGDGAGW